MKLLDPNAVWQDFLQQCNVCVQEVKLPLLALQAIRNLQDFQLSKPSVPSRQSEKLELDRFPAEQATAERVAGNHAILLSVSHCFDLAARQGLALRGHCDDSTEDSPQGNFMAPEKYWRRGVLTVILEISRPQIVFSYIWPDHKGLK